VQFSRLTADLLTDLADRSSSAAFSVKQRHDGGPNSQAPTTSSSGRLHQGLPRPVDGFSALRPAVRGLDVPRPLGLYLYVGALTVSGWREETDNIVRSFPTELLDADCYSPIALQPPQLRRFTYSHPRRS